MKNLYQLIKKNIKLLIRSKGSALIVILAPLLLILFLGFSYNTSQTNLNIGVYAPSYTEDVNSFLMSLQEEYKIIKYDITKECIEDIKKGFTHTCLVLPENFQIQDNSPKQIIFHIDQTKINLVSIITDTLNQKFNLKSQELSQNIASEILTKFSNTLTKINEKKSQIDTAKTTSQQAATQTSNIQSSLSILDLTIPTTNYTSVNVNSLKSDLDDKIDEAKSLVSSSNLNSSEKSEINTQLNELSEKVSGNATGSLGEVSSFVSQLQLDIDDMKIKLTSASTKFTSTTNQLAELSSSLSESVNSLNSIQTTLTNIQEDLASQKVTDPSIISSPLTIKIEKIAIEESNLNYMFPSIVILVIMFISLLLGTTLVMMEKHNPAYFRNFIVPIKRIIFILSTYLTVGFLVLIQIIIIFGISLIFLENVITKFPVTALILFIISSIFAFIGMIIGYLFTSEDTGALASISVGSLFLFLSGTILPVESMSSFVIAITNYNPFVIGEKLIREVFIFSSSITAIWQELLILLGYVIILFIIIIIIDFFGRKHFLNKAMFKHHKKLRQKKLKKLK